MLSWARDQQFQFTSIWELMRLIFPILFQVCTSETFHLLWSTLAKVTNYCASRYQSPLLQISPASADKSKLQDDCSLSMEYTWSNCISQLLNTLDGGIQQQLWGLKVRGVQRGKKKKKTMFCNLEAYFSSCYFFITPLPLHLKDEFRWFLECEVALP